MLLGISAGLLGASLFKFIPFAQHAAGLIVIALGLLMTGVFGPVLARFGLRLDGISLPRGRGGGGAVHRGHGRPLFLDVFARMAGLFRFLI